MHINLDLLDIEALAKYSQIVSNVFTSIPDLLEAFNNDDSHPITAIANITTAFDTAGAKKIHLNVDYKSPYQTVTLTVTVELTNIPVTCKVSNIRKLNRPNSKNIYASNTFRNVKPYMVTLLDAIDTQFTLLNLPYRVDNISDHFNCYLRV